MMRKTYIHIVSCVFALIILFCMTGCASTEKTARIAEANEQFLGDFNPIQLENCMGVSCSLTGNLSPLEFEVYLVPRQNTVEFHFSYGINKVALVLNYQERLQLADAITQYFEAYDAGELPEREPNKKNYFTRSSVTVAWGVMSLSYTADTFMRSNYEFLEPGKPYFLLTSEASNAMNADSLSPNMNLYFTPSQLETIVTLLNQDDLQARVDELNHQAFGW